MPELKDFNGPIIDEFRANEGRVGGVFKGAPMILVHHKGRKSGIERVNPLVYQAIDGGYAIFASKGGVLDHPDWYLNLVADPVTTVEVGTETIAVTAREATADERERIWDRQKRDNPGFAEYETKAAPRVIPVVVLEPAAP